jgi:hypothetical protein
MFKYSNESAIVKQCVGHMLKNIDYNSYVSFLRRADRYPERDHRFVVFEYVQSPVDSVITSSENVPLTRLSIHSVMQDRDFDTNMKRLFGDVVWYTRRKMDYSVVPERTTNLRQVVILIRKDDMPPLIPIPNLSFNQTFLNFDQDNNLNWNSNRTVMNNYQHNP